MTKLYFVLFALILITINVSAQEKKQDQAHLKK